jgi:hypothetical protein
MLGLASVVGLTDLIPHLQAAEAALRKGDGHALSTALDAAMAILGPHAATAGLTDPR